MLLHSETMIQYTYFAELQSLQVILNAYKLYLFSFYP